MNVILAMTNFFEGRCNFGFVLLVAHSACLLQGPSFNTHEELGLMPS